MIQKLAALLLRKNNCDIILHHFPEYPQDINLYPQPKDAFSLGMLIVLPPPLPSEGTNYIKILPYDVFLRQYTVTEKKKKVITLFHLCHVHIQLPGLITCSMHWSSVVYTPSCLTCLNHLWISGLAQATQLCTIPGILGSPYTITILNPGLEHKAGTAS